MLGKYVRREHTFFSSVRVRLVRVISVDSNSPIICINLLGISSITSLLIGGDRFLFGAGKVFKI